MPYRLKLYPRRYLPLHQRDLFGTDSLFRIQQKKIMKLMMSSKTAYEMLSKNGKLNPLLSRRLILIINLLRRIYFINMVVEVPNPGPKYIS